MINILEIAVYAAILAGNDPFSCFGYEQERVTCSNGLSATIEAPATIVFSDGTKVSQNGGFPIFSNGTKSWLDSAGWVAFSTGVQVRRFGGDEYRFSTGLVCQTQLPDFVECTKTGHVRETD